MEQSRLGRRRGSPLGRDPIDLTVDDDSDAEILQPQNKRQRTQVDTRHNAEPVECIDLLDDDDSNSDEEAVVGPRYAISLRRGLFVASPGSRSLNGPATQTAEASAARNSGEPLRTVAAGRGGANASSAALHLTTEGRRPADTDLTAAPGTAAEALALDLTVGAAASVARNTDERVPALAVGNAMQPEATVSPAVAGATVTAQPAAADPAPAAGDDATGGTRGGGGGTSATATATAAAAAAVGDNESSDSDLEVVSEKGQVTTRDFPHPRPDCFVHKFKAPVEAPALHGDGHTLARVGAGGEGNPQNAKFCKQCYCFVCDVKASECQFWGTGEGARDHSNASPCRNWKRLRLAVREARNPNARRELLRADFEGRPLPPPPPPPPPPRQAAPQPPLRFAPGRAAALLAAATAGAVQGGTHLRPQCPKYMFQRGVRCRGNWMHCKQCICCSCGILAQQCRSWGSGMSDTDHANRLEPWAIDNSANGLLLQRPSRLATQLLGAAASPTTPGFHRPASASSSSFPLGAPRWPEPVPPLHELWPPLRPQPSQQLQQQRLQLQQLQQQQLQQLQLHPTAPPETAFAAACAMHSAAGWQMAAPQAAAGTAQVPTLLPWEDEDLQQFLADMLDAAQNVSCGMQKLQTAVNTVRAFRAGGPGGSTGASTGPTASGGGGAAVAGGHQGDGGGAIRGGDADGCRLGGGTEGQEVEPSSSNCMETPAAGQAAIQAPAPEAGAGGRRPQSTVSWPLPEADGGTAAAARVVCGVRMEGEADSDGSHHHGDSGRVEDLDRGAALAAVTAAAVPDANTELEAVGGLADGSSRRSDSVAPSPEQPAPVPVDKVKAAEAAATETAVANATMSEMTAEPTAGPQSRKPPTLNAQRGGRAQPAEPLQGQGAAGGIMATRRCGGGDDVSGVQPNTRRLRMRLRIHKGRGSTSAPALQPDTADDAARSAAKTERLEAPRRQRRHQRPAEGDRDQQHQQQQQQDQTEPSPAEALAAAEGGEGEFRTKAAAATMSETRSIGEIGSSGGAIGAEAAAAASASEQPAAKAAESVAPAQVAAAPVATELEVLAPVNGPTGAAQPDHRRGYVREASAVASGGCAGDGSASQSEPIRSTGRRRSGRRRAVAAAATAMAATATAATATATARAAAAPSLSDDAHQDGV